MAARNKQFSGCEAKYARVVEAFSFGGGKGFGRRTLKVDGKDLRDDIPAGQFVVKLPKERSMGWSPPNHGEYFDPGRGEPMKEWVVLTAKPWVEFAEEAYHFVK
ncbi:MAG: hypothetical protein JO313_00505 [Verrucomicrobia bacterium]|nr:hypothetical protein [Verrucomicrobiota bacterium]